MWSFIWSYTVVYTVGNQCVARFKKPVHMVNEVIGIGFPFRPISSKIIGNRWSAAKGLSVHPYSQIYCCLFRKQLIISERMSLVLCQTDNLQFSFIMYHYWRVLSVYTCQELTWQNLEVSEFSFLRKSTKKEVLDTHLGFSITITIPTPEGMVSSYRVCDTVT